MIHIPVPGKEGAMRTLSDILRTYNTVNTPEGRKYTTRFFVGLIAVGVVGFATFWALSGPDTADEAHFAEEEQDETDPSPDDEDTPDGEILPEDLLGDVGETNATGLLPH
jgi:hypothetical protein